MRNFTSLFIAIVICSLFVSCDGKQNGRGLVGYYVDMDQMAKTYQFDRINEAIANNELLASYKYDGERHNYYATRDFFFPNGDGMWWSSTGHYGACRFMPMNYKGVSTDTMRVIEILNKNTLISHHAWLWDPNYVPYNAIILGSVYGGTYIGNLVYISYSQSTYTYTRVDNKIYVSNGDIYTIVDGGLIEDGYSAIMSKYNPQ